MYRFVTHSGTLSDTEFETRASLPAAGAPACMPICICPQHVHILPDGAMTDS